MVSTKTPYLGVVGYSYNGESFVLLPLFHLLNYPLFFIEVGFALGQLAFLVALMVAVAYRGIIHE